MALSIFIKDQQLQNSENVFLQKFHLYVVMVTAYGLSYEDTCLFLVCPVYAVDNSHGWHMHATSFLPVAN